MLNTDIELQSCVKSDAKEDALSPTEPENGETRGSVSDVSVLKDMDEHKNLINTTTEHNVDKNMVSLFAGAACCATIYIIFPVLNSKGETNYWVYYMLKELWWALFGNAGFVEMAEASLPGSPTWIYCYCYILGMIIPPALHVLAWAVDATDDPILNTLAVTSSLIVTTFFYSYWQLTSDDAEDHMKEFRVSSVAEEGVTFDTFSAVMSTDDYEEDDIDENGEPIVKTRASSLMMPSPKGKKSSMSAYKAAWLKTKEKFARDANKLARRKSQRAARESFGSGTVDNPLNANNASGADSGLDTVKEESSEACYDEDLEQDILEANSWEEGVSDDRLPYPFNIFPDYCEKHKLLPRFRYQEWGETPGAHITTHSRKTHLAATVAFYVGWVVIFFIMMEFTFHFRESAPGDRMLWFVGFTIASTACKVAMKKLGLYLDKGKVGTCSMFFVAEFMCTLFYFTFYRMLFEEFVGWDVFLGIQCAHMVLEWLLYCVRATHTFYKFFKTLPPFLAPVKNMVIMKGLSHRDWQVFLSLDFAIRAEIMIFSGPVFILMFLVTSQCYWVRSYLKPISLLHFDVVVLQIIISSVLEVINGYAMYKVFFESRKLKMYKYSVHCFSDMRFYVIAFCIAVCLFINPFAAFESYFLNFTYE